jgi:hyperosmotically inducible periplasmic protein
MKNLWFPPRSSPFPASLAIASLCSLFILLGAMNSLFAATNAQSQNPRGAAANQAWLMNEVRHQLVMLPYYSVFDNLQYQVKDDKVTLSGQVTEPTLKDNAAKAVKDIEGVQSVDNQIEVLPLSPMDQRIRRAEFRAIYSFPSLQRYANMAVPPIHIIVKNGHVTLEGVVATEGDKIAANLSAKSVSGTFSVTNNLRVESGK